MLKFLQEKGMVVVKLSPEEEARVTDRCAEKIWNDWTNEAESRGIPGKEFLERFRTAVAAVQ